MNSLKDMIPRYLTGRMSPDERAKFESALEKDPELKNEFEEIKNLSNGMGIFDEVSDGHIDSELLVEFAENPNRLNGDLRKEFEDHLRTCSSCREELAICKEAMSAVSQSLETTKKNILAGIVDWLLTPKLSLRPAYGLIILLLVAVPYFYVIHDSAPSISMIANFEIVESGIRGESFDNELLIPSNTDLITLEFIIPILKGRIYDFEIYDSHDRLIFSKNNNRAEKVFDWQFPVSYFSDGSYTMKVVKRESGIEAQEIYTFQIKVRFID